MLNYKTEIKVMNYKTFSILGLIKIRYSISHNLWSFRPLNDGTQGARFYIFGLKGIYRKRALKSNGLRISNGKSTRIIDIFKRTIYLEKRSNKRSNRKLTSTFA